MSGAQTAFFNSPEWNCDRLSCRRADSHHILKSRDQLWDIDCRGIFCFCWQYIGENGNPIAIFKIVGSVLSIRAVILDNPAPLTTLSRQTGFQQRPLFIVYIVAVIG